MSESTSYCLVPGTPFFKLDMRDRISLLLGFCEALNVHAAECLLNFECEELKLYLFMGFRLSDHNQSFERYTRSESLLVTVFEVFDGSSTGSDCCALGQLWNKRYEIKGCNGNGGYRLFDDLTAEIRKIDTLFFYKAIELNSRGGVGENFRGLKSRFCYVSGYAQERPPTNDVIIGPEWDWMTDADVRLSGVNFMSDLRNLNDNNSEVEKKYRCIYVGSSSINKLAPLALLILMLTRLFSIGPLSPDVFICFRFYGFKGGLVWFFLRILKILVSIFRCDIEMILSERKVDKKAVEHYLARSQLGVIPYLREGFPRIIGDMMLNGCEPVILKWMKYGGREFERLVDLRYTIFQAIKKIGGANKNSASGSLNFKRANSFFEPDKRLQDFLSRSNNSELLRNQLRWINEESVPKYFYSILTNDITWNEKPHGISRTK